MIFNPKTIWVALCFGEYHSVINGEKVAAPRAMIIKAFRTYQEGLEELKKGKPRPPEPEKWGICITTIEPLELPE